MPDRTSRRMPNGLERTGVTGVQEASTDGLAPAVL
jgi:hypothetical protein